MIEVKFKEIINNIFQNNFPTKIAVAVSGGIDSMALVFLLNEFIRNTDVELVALTVDHKIRSNSSSEAVKVSEELLRNKIKSHILTSYLPQAPSSNIEANLREVRYSLLNKFCLENKINHLFVGHHLQDNTENFLIRLFRGSGIDGLSAIDYISSYQDLKIVRPLLDFYKNDLKNYLINNNIKWVEDESNEQDNYLRNKIRKFINSLEDKDLINQRITLATRSILENKKIVESSLIENSREILEFSDMGYFLVKKANFCNLSKEKSLRYLAWMLMEVSGNYYKPRLKYLENLYHWILIDKEHKKRCFYGCEIEKYDNSKLIIYRERAKIEDMSLKESTMIWDNRFKIKSNDKTRNLVVGRISAVELNKLNINHKMHGVLKNIIYTLPVLKKDDNIEAIPHLHYYKDKKATNDIEISFDKKTNL